LLLFIQLFYAKINKNSRELSWANNIQWRIDNFLRHYHPGQTDYQLKIRPGGKLVALFAYLILKPANFDEDLQE